MALFTVSGDVDPFLRVSLKRGESVYCESDAMVMMESALELKGKTRGGLGGTLMHSFAEGESVFQQQVEAVHGDGDCLLAPTLPGAMQVIEVGPRNFMLAGGAFVAASSGVALTVRTQHRGLFVTETGGSGQVVVSGFGSISVVEAGPGKDVVIDSAHLVCWDSALRYEVPVASRSGGGLFGAVLNSQAGGEGMVLRFSGAGKVLICSRSRKAFQAWAQQDVLQE